MNGILSSLLDSAGVIAISLSHLLTDILDSIKCLVN